MAFPLPDEIVLPTHMHIIGGEMDAGGSGASIPHIYPGNGWETGTLRLAGPAEVDAAVAAARAAAPAWRALAGDKRRNLMHALAARIEQHAGHLALLGSIEKGEPATNARHMPASVANKLRYFAGWADKIQGHVVSTFGGPSHDYVAYEPYGVVGGIIPWNGPLYAAVMMLAPALAAGNCIVLKAPELAPYTTLRLGELVIDAGFPAGVVNIVTGGPEVGEAIVAHRGVDKIAFIGSGPTARKVLRTAADGIKPCCLELGGKSAVIVFADADLPDAARRGLRGAIAANGQGCVNGTRLLVQRPVYDRYLDMLAQHAAQVRIGDPFDVATALGPVISEAAAQRILGMVSTARQEGGRLVTGGERLGGAFAEGYFLAPTIIADVANDSAIAQHEVFGPVLTVTPFDTQDEVVALANGTDYGLGAYIHTQSLRRAHSVAAALDAGMIQVNASGEGMAPCAPFGGMKQSGFGRMGGEAGLKEFLRVKNVWVNLAAPAPAP